MTTPQERIEQTARDLGLSLTSEFIPWSKSRNRGQPHRSLNWRVSVWHGGTHLVLTVDYSAGIAHCPSYRQGDRSVDHAEAIGIETEHGYDAARLSARVIEPETADVLHSLVSDAEALDHACFEDWAGDLGYDEDSREAERAYRACLDTGLRLRAAIGESGLARLRAACQDY